MATVFVLSENGKPLMPTTRCGHVRQLLKKNKARVVAMFAKIAALFVSKKRFCTRTILMAHKDG